jgi:acetyl/propionyl-CoA carboxylase alpha subunit
LIQTLLVANRGEIARRVMRAARAQGIRTVAVYSEPDAHDPHVTDADRAVALRGSTSAETYLDQDQILAAARATGADAIHPGYGFLSENAAFARAVAAGGLTWVGPPPEAIETMGVKHAAKDLARAAGVPTLPDALVTPDTDLATAGDDVGFPLLVKASAGGGGTGMRRVDRPEDLDEAVRSAGAEATRSFGDGTVFLERLLLAPRHVEIQVLADAHGHVVHLGERECSIQRRHQKVVEEAPSPAVDDELRSRMGATAVGLAEKLGYVGAGTVEFLLAEGEHADRGASRSLEASIAAPLASQPGFFFLEMNTRLQVEHPVTEEVWGVDLVALQLSIAEGAELPFAQDDLAPHGHAIEVRLYAEDPALDDRPSPGLLHRYAHDTDLRWEDAVGASGTVSAFSDPMIAKVIAHADTRPAAARRLAAGLARAEIHGVRTNRDLLVRTLLDPDFAAGATRTDFLERHPDLRRPAPPPRAHVAALVATTAAARRADDPHAPPGFRLLRGTPPARAELEGPDGEHVVTYRLRAARGDTTIDLDGHPVALRDLTPDAVRVTTGGVERACRVARYADVTVVDDGEHSTTWRTRPRLPEADAALVAGSPVAEVPGTVVEVLVAPGETVTAGQRLVVLEAMKMEHPALAAADGVVEAVHVEVGQYVEAHATLVTLAAADG